MKKDKPTEMRIYELLGIKTFRKMAFAFRDFIWNIFLFKMSKEKRKKFLYHSASNYNLGKVKSLEDIKKFKFQLYANATIHIFAFLLLINGLTDVFAGTASLSSTIIVPLCEIINIYCIMLQRYNCIRINQFIKKMNPIYEKQKDEIKNKIRKEDSLLIDHSYKIVDTKKRETNISFEDLIANATIDELKEYYEYLATFQKVNQIIKEKEYYNSENPVTLSIPMEKRKTLKLELNTNKLKNSSDNNKHL